MRKTKSHLLRAIQIGVTIPRSFKSFTEDCASPALAHSPWTPKEGLSATLQRAIAENILGVNFREFSFMYDPRFEDLRTKRDPIAQEYIRAARWVAESTILSARAIDLTHLSLIVYWHIPQVTAELLIDLTSVGFRKVIYDFPLLSKPLHDDWPQGRPSSDLPDDYLFAYPPLPEAEERSSAWKTLLYSNQKPINPSQMKLGPIMNFEKDQGHFTFVSHGDGNAQECNPTWAKFTILGRWLYLSALRIQAAGHHSTTDLRAVWR